MGKKIKFQTRVYLTVAKNMIKKVIVLHLLATPVVEKNINKTTTLLQSLI